MLLESILLSSLLAAAVAARALEASPPENIHIKRTAAIEQPSNLVESWEAIPTIGAALYPIQTGIDSKCNAYYRVEQGDHCDTVVEKFDGLALDDFHAWNPAVGEDCSHLLHGYYVCVDISDVPLGLPTAASGLFERADAVPSPVQSGIASNCDNYYKVVSGDTCLGITYQSGITLSQFYSWNPAVGSNCQVLLAGYYVCVGVTATTTSTTSTTSPSPTPTPTNPPEPTQPGITASCTEYYEARSGDTCISIVQKFQSQGSSITLSLFEKWNPAVGSDCLNLLAGYYYCVATAKTSR